MGCNGGDEGTEPANVEDCTASAEPNDGTVFFDEVSPVLFIAVGYCPRAERGRTLAAGSVRVDLTLEPGGRKFQVGCLRCEMHKCRQRRRRTKEIRGDPRLHVAELE